MGKVMMKKMGFDLSREEIVAMILEVDEDGSGEMEFPEFVAMMTQKFLEKDPKEEIGKAFSLFAGEGSSKIQFEDLRRLSDELGEPMTDQELQEMIDEADVDGDGELGLEEFIAAMKRTQLWEQ